jgi:hypothetical protein
MERNGSEGQVTITLVDGRGGRTTETCAITDFEQAEHGAIIGARRTIPWQRIERVSWELPPREPDGEASGPRVRVTIDDGTPAGEDVVVPADRFEVLGWAISLLVDDRADTALGTIHQRRVIVPWQAVREYERLLPRVADEPAVVPGRPDATG